MKNLKDLKEEIINKKINNFYIFYGEDYGLRYHYIKEISKNFDDMQAIYDVAEFNKSKKGLSIFNRKTLYITHGQIEFSKKKMAEIQHFINNLKDDTFIFSFEEELPSSTFWKDYNDYITYFPVVDDKISLQFVDSELSLNQSSKEELAGNCLKNYNNILLEADKIRNYAQACNISEQSAYDSLYVKNQLLYEYEPFYIYNLTNDILKGNTNTLSYWYNLISNKYSEEFWLGLENIMNDYLIAYFIARYGSYHGSGKAYENGLSWFRIKTIKEFAIPYKPDDLLEKAFKIAKLDKDIKTGQLEKDKLLDYFICLIL